MTRTVTQTRAFLAATLLTLVVPAAAEAGTRVTVFDVVTTPGQTVTLRAKCERTFGRWIHPDLKGKTVEFKLNGRRLGKAVTDDQGIASVKLTPTAVGVSVLSARIVGKRAVGTGQVRVIPASKPVIVFDIDGTLSSLPDFLVPFWGARAKAFSGGPELARELAKTCEIVYLTARDDSLAFETWAFLARHNFPPGAVIFDDYGFTDPDQLEQWDPSNHGKFKLNVLKELQAHGITIAAGIGNASTDGEAYVGAGVKSYLRTDKTEAGSFTFEETSELRTKLLADKVLVQSSGLSGGVRGTTGP